MSTSSISSRALSLLIALLLSVFCLSLTPRSASATGTDLAISDAKAAVAASQMTLSDAESQLASITQEFNSLNAEVDELQTKIDDLSAKVIAAQDAMLKGREALGNAAHYEYRNNTVSQFLSVILESRNWSELTKNYDYITQIMDFQSDEIAKQKKLKEELDAVASELNAEKDSQEKKLTELEGMRIQAQTVVNSVASQLASNQEKLASLQRQAEELKRVEQVKEQPIASNANTIDRVDSPAGAQPEDTGSKPTASETPDSASPAPSAPAPEPAAPATDGGGWLTGRATAYGGSTDPYTPNPGWTATGAPCNDNSMGVAVPMAMPNYRSYFGRTVEISYGGRTVYATVNDCGGMRGGYISLDLQPGVFKALGYGTCYDWGVRTVSYRFL